MISNMLSTGFLFVGVILWTPPGGAGTVDVDELSLFKLGLLKLVLSFTLVTE